MLTLADAVTAYLAQGTVEGWSPYTLRIYTAHLGQLTTFLRRSGCRRPADVTPDDLDAFLQALVDDDRALSTRVSIACLLRRFFRSLQAQGRIVTNPARALATPDDDDPALLPTPLSEADLAAVFAALPRATVTDLRNRCLLELLYGCALRAGEACALDVDDLDLSRRTLHVRRGKGAQQRLLPLEGAALAATKDYLAVRRMQLKGPDTGILLLNQYGRRLTTVVVLDIFHDLNVARGPEARHLHAHLFRHSAAVHLLRSGLDVRVVQAFLGHARLDTTKVYLRLVDSRLKEDYEKAMPEIDVGLAGPPLPGSSPDQGH